MIIALDQIFILHLTVIEPSNRSEERLYYIFETSQRYEVRALYSYVHEQSEAGISRNTFVASHVLPWRRAIALEDLFAFTQ